MTKTLLLGFEVSVISCNHIDIILKIDIDFEVGCTYLMNKIGDTKPDKP